MKLSKKILSVILAVLMAFSTFAVTLSASAAEEPVKPEYTENVTEEDIAELFEDVDTLLVNKVLTGSVIESIFKAMTNSLNGLLMNHANSVEFFTDGIWTRNTTTKRDPDTKELYREYSWYISSPTTALNAERFADLQEYGDGVLKDNLSYLDADKPELANKEGRYDKGGMIKDVAEKKDDQGQVTQEAVEGTFTKFFKAHPIEVNSLDDFKNEINNVVATVVMDGLGLVGALGSKYSPEVDYGWLYQPASGGEPQALYDVFAALDYICDGLGIEQPIKAADCFVGWDANGTSVTMFPTKVWEFDANGEPVMDEKYPTRHAMVDYNNGETKAVDDAIAYIQNIVNALFDGGLVKNVVGVLQNFVSEEGGAKVYKGISLLIDALWRAVNCPFGSNLGAKDVTIDKDGRPQKDEDGNPVKEYSGIAATLKGVYETFQTLPTVGEGDAKRLDLEGLIPLALKLLKQDGNVDVFFDEDMFNDSFDNTGYEKPSSKPIALILKPMAEDLAKVAAAESPADAAKFVVDYLYNSVLVNKYNNKTLYGVLDLGLITVPSNIKTFALDIIDPSDDEATNVPRPLDELLPMAFSAVGEMVDHHVNLEAVAQQEVTCLDDGIAEDCYYCPDCDNYFAKADYPTIEEAAYAAKDTALDKATLITAATGHEFGEVVAAEEPTLYAEGNVEYKPCTKCGKNFAPDADITAADDTAIDITIAKLEGTLGDIDNDGKINAKDVLMVKRHIAKFEGEALDEVQFALADVNADGNVNSLDALLIMQHIAKIIESFPAEAEPAPVEPAPAPAE